PLWAAVPAFLRPAKRVEPQLVVADPAAVENPAEAAARDRHLPTKTASPVRKDRPRCAHFSFCGREGDICYSRLGANVENADDIFVSAGFIAANNHGLFGVELDETFEQIGQLGGAKSAAIYDDVPVCFHIHDHIANWRAF